MHIPNPTKCDFAIAKELKTVKKYRPSYGKRYSGLFSNIISLKILYNKNERSPKFILTPRVKTNKTNYSYIVYATKTLSVYSCRFNKGKDLLLIKFHTDLSLTIYHFKDHPPKNIDLALRKVML